MIEGIPRISVLIITYKQEDLVKRAINSLLEQIDYIYEICVSDDCSPDNTWEVLLDYEKQYPGLFKLNKNEHNLGIFENIEKSWSMASGDVVYNLSGDDECGKDWLMEVVRFIQETKIDYKNELFCIYGDYKAVYPNGDSFICQNNKIQSGKSPFSLGLRKQIGNRSCCYSINVLKKFIKVSRGRSYAVEASQDRQLQLFSETNYYINSVGNIYYARIGVSNNEMRDQEIKREREECMNCLRDTINKCGVVITSKDRNYMELVDCRNRSYRENKLINTIKRIGWFLLSLDLSFGFESVNLKRVLFALARRIPHSKPLNWKV